MTVGRMLRETPASELMEWRAFLALEQEDQAKAERAARAKARAAAVQRKAMKR